MGGDVAHAEIVGEETVGEGGDAEGEECRLGFGGTHGDGAGAAFVREQGGDDGLDEGKRARQPQCVVSEGDGHGCVCWLWCGWPLLSMSALTSGGR